MALLASTMASGGAGSSKPLSYDFCSQQSCEENLQKEQKDIKNAISRSLADNKTQPVALNPTKADIQKALGLLEAAFLPCMDEIKRQSETNRKGKREVQE